MTAKYRSFSRREFLSRSIPGLSLFGIFNLSRAGLFPWPLKDHPFFVLEPKQNIEKGLVAGFRKNYFSALYQQLKKMIPKEAEDTIDEIKKRDQSIIQANQSWIVDPASEYHLLFTTVVLATYQVLLMKIKNRDTVLGIVRYSFLEAQQSKAAKAQFIKMVEKDPDPYAMLVKVSKYKEEKQYGKSFVFERERDDESNYFLNVKKCFYHDFFSANGASELTPVFCDWDNVWGDELKDGRFGVKFERPETIGYGGSVCRFQFTRTEKQNS